MTEKEGVEGFLTSRVGYAVQKLMPMSLTQIIKNPELGLMPAIAPISKGMSMGLATKNITTILATYANDEAYNAFLQNPMAMEKLKGLAPEILDAAEANGYDVKKIVNSAKGQVLSGIYKRLWEAINRNDPKDAERYARQALRVGGSIQGAFRSMKNRSADYTREFSPEMQAAIDDAFGRVKPVEVTP